jgi:hypothetical protein
MFVTVVCAIAILSNIAGVAGQEKRSAREVVVQGEGHNRVWVGGGHGQVAMAGPQGDNTFVFVSSEMSIDGKLVKGAPYSAQAINESVQTLVGGNRIVRQTTSTIYRDSEGRTRREQTISVVGGFSAEGGPAQTTFINDPVAGVNYILDVKNRTARKIDTRKIAVERRLVETVKAKRAAEYKEPAMRRSSAKDGRRKAAAAGDEFEMRTEPASDQRRRKGPGAFGDDGNKKNTKT